MSRTIDRCACVGARSRRRPDDDVQPRLAPIASSLRRFRLPWLCITGGAPSRRSTRGARTSCSSSILLFLFDLCELGRPGASHRAPRSARSILACAFTNRFMTARFASRGARGFSPRSVGLLAGFRARAFDRRFPAMTMTATALQSK